MKSFVFTLFLLGTSLFSGAEVIYQGPLFDTHLHYNADDAKRFPPKQIIEIFNRNNIQNAVVTSSPSEHAQALYSFAPNKIIPILGIYNSYKDKTHWPNYTNLSSTIEKKLKQGYWQGIGELHIFAKDRHSKTFHKILNLASNYKLILQIHGDPAVIDTVYDIAPDQVVLWAHASTYPYPDLIADYLERYPDLIIDLSVRDARIAPAGVIREDWYELFIRFPGRFTVGVDTFSTERWGEYGKVVREIRGWLGQLPREVAAQIAFKNAEQIFLTR